MEIEKKIQSNQSLSVEQSRMVDEIGRKIEQMNEDLPDWPQWKGNIQWSKGWNKRESKLDFKKPWSFTKFRKKDANYMIASAENPMWKQASKWMNEKTHKAFGKFMKENRIVHKEQLGHYGQPERSYIISIENAKQRNIIDEWLEANSKQAENILIKDWKAIRYDPRTKEAYSVDLGKAKKLVMDNNAEDFYSMIDWRKYQLPLYNTKLENPISIKEFENLYSN